MASYAVKRISREVKEIMCSEDILKCAIKVEMIDDNWTDLRAEIAGPPGTPYEGGKFALEIKVPDKYPLSAPRVRFATRIWHPNVSSVTGAVCLDILKANWTATMTLCSILLSLQALLAAAEPNEPQDAIVASQFKDKNLFEITARHWTNVYAGGPHREPDCDEKIQRLRDIGVNEHDARVALSKENWDLATAAGRLFS
ncbi:ubiquitin-conjugating enzyme E2-22 kDa-like [Glossina fuscipes]|uniref:Ubiquitin-conjugating enzyme E2-22 kDa-like n=1 Tax=Glossina fuscipes TaxID=7396 RepID=A0A9C5ZHV9_9MUSC|nr:ubiquitin-conjugating enzyme E2-22 kDa-like [Glossina fuscipes]KAI9578714.1 hypothetical protein GQX74_009288 [Glossina fuscipes]